MKRACFFFGIFLALTHIIYAQSARFKTTEDAQHIDKMNEYSWEQRVQMRLPDFLRYTYQVTREPDVRAGDQLSDVDGCGGYANEAPFYRVEWRRQSIRESEQLRFFTVSRADTVLIIQEPDGDWVCADDYSSTSHALYDIARPRTGTYSIWIANKIQQRFTADLFVTLGSSNPRPNQYDASLTEPIVYSNPAAGSGSGIMYVEVKNQTSGCEISIDVIVTEMDGATDIRVVAYPRVSNQRIRSTGRYSEDGFTAIVTEAERTPGFGSTRYDYSGETNSQPPFGMFIPNSVLPDSVSSYNLELVLQEKNRNTWVDLTSYTTPSTDSCRV